MQLFQVVEPRLVRHPDKDPNHVTSIALFSPADKLVAAYQRIVDLVAR